MTQPTLHRVTQQLVLKRGTRANLDLLATAVVGRQGEPAYTTDSKQLFIHDGTLYAPVQSLDMALTFEDEIIVHNGSIVYTY